MPNGNCKLEISMRCLRKTTESPIALQTLRLPGKKLDPGMWHLGKYRLCGVRGSNVDWGVHALAIFLCNSLGEGCELDVITYDAAGASWSLWNWNQEFSRKFIPQVGKAKSSKVIIFII
jgi:hypothetical protein